MKKEKALKIIAWYDWARVAVLVTLVALGAIALC